MKALLVLAAFAAASAHAAERRVLLSDFDRVEIDGDYDVVISTGRLVPVRVSGAPQAIERVSVEQRGRTLVIRPAAGQTLGMSDAGPVRIQASTNAVRSLRASGSARVAVSSLTAPKTDITLGGSVVFETGRVASDELTLSLDGSGQAKLAGRAAKALVILRGSGAIDAKALDIADLNVSAEGSGKVDITASKTARVEGLGTAAITVEGNAKCDVTSGGLGIIACGTR